MYNSSRAVLYGAKVPTHYIIPAELQTVRIIKWSITVSNIMYRIGTRWRVKNVFVNVSRAE